MTETSLGLSDKDFLEQDPSKFLSDDVAEEPTAEQKLDM